MGCGRGPSVKKPTRRPLASAIALSILLGVASIAAWEAPRGTLVPGPEHPAALPRAAVDGPTAPVGGWWQLPTPGDTPSNRTGFQMAYDSGNGSVLLFGGCPQVTFPELDGCVNPSNQTWSFSNGSWTELEPRDSPPARYYGTMVDDPAAGCVLLFGGANGAVLFNDTWAFSDGNWVPLHPDHSPPAIEEAAAGFDRADAEVVLFGGVTSTDPMASNETWTFSAGNWTEVVGPVHPPGWVSPAMAAAPDGGVLLYGGITNLFFPQSSQQTWSYASGGWANLTSSTGPSQPPAEFFSLATFDASRNETMLFGGGDFSSAPSTTWAYSATGVWQQVLGSDRGPPGAFYETGAAFDLRGNYTVEFGEEALGAYNGYPTVESLTSSTWVLLATLQDAGIDRSGSTSPNGNATFTASVSGGLGPYVYRWSFGDASFSSASAPTHAFDRTGEFVVNLTVTDRVGQVVNATIRVDVSTAAVPWGVAEIPAIVAGSLFGALLASTALAVGLVVRRRRRRAPPAPSVLPPSGDTGVR